MSDATTAPDRSPFLPDFCALGAVFTVVVLAELLAIVLAVASAPAGAFWERLSQLSMLVQWVALGSAAALCATRRWLAALDQRLAGVLALALCVAVAVAVAALAWSALAWAGLPPSAGAGELMLRCGVVTLVVGAAVLRYLYLQHDWRARVRAAAQARLEALQARIRPHFLFNSMNTIAALTRADPPGAERAVEDLADLFRASLAGGGSTVPLTEELALCRKYVAIEQLRLGERLQLDWQADELPEAVRVPPLSIQPLLENAIYHGIEPQPRGGTVALCCRVKGERVRIAIENPKPVTPAARGQRMALENVRERLGALYGAAGELRVQADGERYRVEVVLPMAAAPGGDGTP